MHSPVTVGGVADELEVVDVEGDELAGPQRRGPPEPVGTGPYVLREYRDSEVAIYDRNPDYWNPDYEGRGHIEIYYFPDAQTRLNALKVPRRSAHG